jgi:hypothetical protein
MDNQVSVWPTFPALSFTDERMQQMWNGYQYVIFVRKLTTIRLALKDPYPISDFRPLSSVSPLKLPGKLQYN